MFSRLIFLVEGDPDEPANFSGIPYHFSRALRRSLDRVGIRLDVLDTSHLLNVEEMLTQVPGSTGRVSGGLPVSEVSPHKLRFEPNRRLLRAIEKGGGQDVAALLPRYYAEVHAHMEERLAAVSAGPDDVVLSQNYFFPWTGTRPVHYFLDALLSDFYFEGPYSTAPLFPGRAAVADTYRHMERQALRSAPHVFCFSEALLRQVRTRHTLPLDRLTVVGAGPNLPERTRAKTPTDESRPLRLLFVGLDFERKGGRVLLSALDELGESVTAVVVTARPQQWTCSRPGVTVLPPQDRNALTALYRSSDVFVLPTLLEPYGLVLLEAMSFGLPVIATDTGAVPEVLGTDRFPQVVRPGDPGEFAGAVRHLHQHRHLLRQLGTRNFLRVRHRFGWDRCADLIVERLWEP